MSVDDWRLNNEADRAATSGMDMHTEDPGSLALFQYRSRIVRLWQAHLVRLYMRFRMLPKFRGIVAPGLHTRRRPQTAPHMARSVRTDLRWQAQHVLSHCAQGAACVRCGRVTRALRQGRLQQWRRPCVPLRVHALRLQHGHNPSWSGVWGCTLCQCTGSQLHKRGCHPLRRPPSGRGPSDDYAPGPPDAAAPDPSGGAKRRCVASRPQGATDRAQSLLTHFSGSKTPGFHPPQAYPPQAPSHRYCFRGWRRPPRRSADPLRG